MRIERTKNSLRNFAFGVLLKIYQTFVPFAMRTLMIYFMGVQYLGLNGLFTSILQVLNLAELGVGSAMVYSMYKPIAEDNETKICALMGLYKKYYTMIGFVIALGGSILTPFIPYLIKSDMPADLNVYILYLMNLAATVLSYWMFAYKNALFQAHQRLDVTSKTSLITTTIQYGLQAFIIIFVKDYYLYVIVALSTQGLSNLITAFIASKMYPTYEPKGKLEKSELKEINRQIKDLFTAKFGGVILNSADTVVISAFLGLTVLAEYQNYYFILSSIMGLVTVLFNSCTAGIGNSIVVETREKNYADFKKLFFLIVWIAGWCTCCLLCIYQPFMKLWVGSDLMLPFSVVILLCIYYYIYEINQLLNVYKDAAGIWHKDRYRPLITALSNLVLNLLMVQFWGVYGIILSTIIATLFIGMPWLTHNLFTTLFDTSEMKKFIASMLSKTLIVILVCGVTYFASSILDFSDIGNLIYRGAVCCIISNLAFYVLLRKHQEYKECVNLIGKILHR